MKFFAVSFVLSLMLCGVLAQEVIQPDQEDDGLIPTGVKVPVENPPPVTPPSPSEISDQETASTQTIPTYTEPSTESPIGRGADLVQSASSNQLDSQSLEQRDGQNVTNQTESVLPMIVKTDDGYILWKASGSFALTNSASLLIACLLIRLLLF